MIQRHPITGPMTRLRVRQSRHDRTSFARCTIALIFTILLIGVGATPTASAQPVRIPVSSGQQPDATEADAVARGTASAWLSAISLPIEALDADATLSGLRVHAWREGTVDRLLLDGWVTVKIGDTTLRARTASVWINREFTAESDLNNIAIYFEGLDDARRPSGVTASASQLLVTSVTSGKVLIQSDGFQQAFPDRPGFLDRAETRLVQYLAQLRNQTTRQGPSVVRDATPADPNAVIRAPYPPGSVTVRTTPSRILQPQAVVQLQVQPGEQNLVYQIAEDGSEGLVTLKGPLAVQYLEATPRPGERDRRRLTLTADRAVLFTEAIRLEDVLTGRLNAESVRGVYLEGDVLATDGEYTLRGPRMYYEMATNRAIVLDAVLSTYDEERRVPIYVRASEVRQLSEDEWEGEDVQVSTSEFFVPHLSLAADSFNLQRRVGKDGEQKQYIDARNIQLRAGELPFFAWPVYRGPAQQLPLRGLAVGGNERNGIVVKTKWDLFALAGQEEPERLNADLILDYYSERGPGVGTEIDYKTDRGSGDLFAYLMQDDGIDRLSSGVEKDQNDQSRGVFLWRQREELRNDWSYIAELNYISDETFIDEFYENDAETAREFTTRLYLKQQRDNSQVELFANYDLNDFIANQDLLQSQGFLVEKLPEFGYYRYADSLFDNRVSWTSEYRLSRMRLSFPRHTLADIGQGFRGFGLPSNTDLSTQALASGFTEDFVSRFHTRQEFAAPMSWGIFKVVPFVSGHLMLYDDDFNTFSRDAEESRYVLAGGVRVSTQFWKVNDSVQSRLFDLHRLRHVVEPNMTAWSGTGNAKATDYPIYDVDVEGVSPGSVVKFGVRNTWQTQRGGPGRWYNVNVLTVNTDVVFHSGEVQGDSTIPRFFDYRPEYSQFGDHFAGDFTWLVSDSLAVAGHSIIDMNESTLARSSIGYRIEHSPALFSYGDVRYFDARDETLVVLGLAYTLTPLYKIRGQTVYDVVADETRNVYGQVTRRTPQFDIGFGVAYNQFREEATVSIVFSPHGSDETFASVLNPNESQQRN